jgi:ribosomal-protein-alanine N-acetyltransferase
MEESQNEQKKTAAGNFGDMFDALGDAMGQIFNDPKLKEKARELGKAAKESAETLGERFKDEEVKAKFKEVGKAAQAFGKNVADIFTEEKSKESTADKPAEPPAAKS